jgi:hypothetical protein
MLTRVVYVPQSHVDKVKNALFDAGAGRYGKYDRCSWQTAGLGQFRPLDDSRPFIGSAGNVEQVQEWRVEMICREDTLPAVLAALRATHPYEEPAFGVYSMVAH